MSLILGWYSLNARPGFHDGGVHDDLESDLKRKLKIEAGRGWGGEGGTRTRPFCRASFDFLLGVTVGVKFTYPGCLKPARIW